MVEKTMQLFGTQTNQAGELSIGGMSVSSLKAQFGTPLYIYDVAYMKEKSKEIQDAFRHPLLQSGVMYASKAFLTIAMAQWIKAEGLLVEVVSDGELYTVAKGGVPMEHVFFHGNAKTIHDCRLAFEYRVGTIILDNAEEFHTFQSLHPGGFVQRVMLRLNPLIDSETHEYIQTTKNDSKFGLPPYAQETKSLIEAVQADARFRFVGIHSHVGSQIVNPNTFYAQVDSMLQIFQAWNREGVHIEEINFGGGFGVAYTKADHEIDLTVVLPEMLRRVVEFCQTNALRFPKVYIEPARSLVGNAGTTLYTVHSTKMTPSGREFCFVDGSMADHIRTVLYQATYDGVVATKMNEVPSKTYRLTGRACESGDIIIRDVLLANPEPGDLIAVSTTGAYHYSMSSNYNRFTKPAVVFVEGGSAKVVVRRETLDDLIRNDVSLYE
jgi:diaminopimelate decarboxylase